jgi:major vault protein
MASSDSKEMVLTPNEFAYVRDDTKGTVLTMVGPCVYPLGQNNVPVIFNSEPGNFSFEESDSWEDAVLRFSTIPEGWYGQLKNPAAKHPVSGATNNPAELEVGRKVNIQGPASFALWPGQMIKIIPGHSMRTNQYLVIRIYDEKQAFRHWQRIGLDKITGITAIEKNPQEIVATQVILNPDEDTTEIDHPENKPAPVLEVGDNANKKSVEMTLVIGQQFVIRGVDAQFFIPPDGIEVVPETPKGKDYVREALTLERLEYCILLNEDGNKRYVSGPDVVFPSPTESFMTSRNEDGKLSRKFKAVELTPTSGIHVKVIAPYDDEGVHHFVGEELFITGKEQMIYFPRQEHAIMKYGDKASIYYAVAIEPGQARYVLDKLTGEVRMVKGPAMFLPDPRKEVIVRRILSDVECSLYYPGNNEVLQLNRQRRAELAGSSVPDYEALLLNSMNFNPEIDSLSRGGMRKSAVTNTAMYSARSAEPTGSFGSAEDSFTRKEGFTPPRTITIDSKYEGAVRVDVWSGYAVQTVDRAGNRKVIRGPQSVLLEYDERLEVLYLSTGKPKTTDAMLPTVYLRTRNNKVADIVNLETSDFINVEVKVSYLVNFIEDESDNWFDVDNYIKLLCDRCRSKLKKVARHKPIDQLYTNITEIVQEELLESSAGTDFGENGMRLVDIDVLSIHIDRDVESMLSKAKMDSFQEMLAMAAFTEKVELAKKRVTISQEDLEAQKKLSEIGKQAKLLNIQTEQAIAEEEHKRNVDIAGKRSELEKMTQETKLELMAEETEARIKGMKKELDFDQKRTELQLENERKGNEITAAQLEVETTSAKELLEAFQPQLVEAINDLTTGEHAKDIARSIAPLAKVDGVPVIDVLTRLTKGTMYEDLFTRMFSGNLLQSGDRLNRDE